MKCVVDDQNNTMKHRRVVEVGSEVIS
jgi:hypothetical protein